MSILIKGIDMPKSCVMCRLYTDKFTDDEGFILECALGGYEYSNCPLIEIPTPHGRMIDRSVLFEEYQNLCNGLLCRDCPFFKENSCSIEEWILNQPPILEAEE